MFRWKSSASLAVSLGEFEQSEDGLRECLLEFMRRLDQQQVENLLKLLSKFASDAKHGRKDSLSGSELFPLLEPTCDGFNPMMAAATLFSCSFSLAIKEIVQFVLDFQQEDLAGQENGQPGQEGGQG